MDKKEVINFVKIKLGHIVDSTDAKYSSGIANTILDLLEQTFNETIKITIIRVNDGQLINAIKTLRTISGLGLKEAKDAVELGQTIFESNDVGLALRYKKELSPYCTLQIDGGGDAMKVLF